jgi:putative colanic acid biosynthesis UDP-glucose lipid carrier transferase
VLFRQTRYGLRKQPFVIYKLRTMTCMEDRGAFRQATVGDARITKVGALLRRTSLDELPQLLNVIKGEMSIVGPRPHPVDLDDSFSDVIPSYDLRFSLRPGITGLAQVSGHRGATPTAEFMERRVRCDLDYISRASLSLDGNILLRTLLVPFDTSVF